MNGQLYLHVTVCKTVKGAAGISDLLALIKVILTIPISSASADHSFSAMRRVKTHIRASMSATRTSDLNLITVVERQLSDAVFDDAESAFDTHLEAWVHAGSIVNENTVTYYVRDCDSMPLFLLKHCDVRDCDSLCLYSY